MRKNKTAGKSGILYFIKGTAAGLAVSAELISLFAFFLTKKDISVSALPYVLIAIGGIGCFIGALISSRYRNLRGIISGAICALAFSALFVPLCFILSGFAGGSYLFIMPVAHLLCGCLGGIISKNFR